MGKTSKRVGVVLSGCGFLDGAEIHEATVTLLALDKRGASIIAMAPNVDQVDVIDHRQCQAMGSSRNVLTESARITRGEIRDMATVRAADLDALIFPGGYGAAKNLCTLAKEGKNLRVNPEVELLIREMRTANKPMGFICIAPVLAAKVLGELHPSLTIGNDRETAAVLEALGARHVERTVDDIAVDQALKVVSTPAYMLGPSIARVAEGIEKLVSAVLEMA